MVRCVGGVVLDSQGRLLVIKRGRPPGAGLWSIPGGRVEPGESDAEALVRELLEETGLRVEPGVLLGGVTRPGPASVVYEIYDYTATVVSGDLAAGDDAAEACWVTAAALHALPTSPGLVEALTSWHVLDE